MRIHCKGAIALGRLSVVALLLASSPGSAQTILKCGTATQSSHIYNQAVEYFARLVADKSKNDIQIQVFPASQLGSERDMVDGLQLGSLEMTLISTTPLGNFVPRIRLFNLPFLFKDRESCYKVLDGPIGAEIAGLLTQFGLRSLAWYETGFLNITNSKGPIEKPADLNGLKIRVMEDDIFSLTMNALGASPLPVAFAELYTALEQKAVDAQENPLSVIHFSRFFEVQPYLTMTDHFYSPAMLLISEIAWQRLTAGQQEVLTDAAVQARDYERNLSAEADRILEAELVKQGMQVSHPDRDPFVQAVAPVYENPAVIKAIGDGDATEGQRLIEAVQEAAR
ncbi:MAG: DctP family TRAP transporter solute-binding subunit [Desulfobacterales bacterium]